MSLRRKIVANTLTIGAAVFVAGAVCAAILLVILNDLKNN